MRFMFERLCHSISKQAIHWKENESMDISCTPVTKKSLDFEYSAINEWIFLVSVNRQKKLKTLLEKRKNYLYSST